jgi:hypothetical protein
VGGYYYSESGLFNFAGTYLPTFNFASLENFQVGSQQSSQNIKRDSSILSTFIFWSIAKFG